MAGNRESQRRYKQANVMRVSVDFNRRTEPELVAHMAAQENKGRYLKDLVRKEVNKDDHEDTAPPEKE